MENGRRATFWLRRSAIPWHKVSKNPRLLLQRGNVRNTFRWEDKQFSTLNNTTFCEARDPFRQMPTRGKKYDASVCSKRHFKHPQKVMVQSRLLLTAVPEPIIFQNWSARHCSGSRWGTYLKCNESELVFSPASAFSGLSLRLRPIICKICSSRPIECWKMCSIQLIECWTICVRLRRAGERAEYFEGATYFEARGERRIESGWDMRA